MECQNYREGGVQILIIVTIIMLMGRAGEGGGGGAELPGRWCTSLSKPGTSPAAGQRSLGCRRPEESGTLPTRRPRRSAPLPFPENNVSQHLFHSQLTTPLCPISLMHVLNCLVMSLWYQRTRLNVRQDCSSGINARCLMSDGTVTLVSMLEAECQTGLSLWYQCLRLDG